MHLSQQLSLRTARNMYTRNNQNIRIAHGSQHDYSKQSKHSKDALFAITNTLIFISDVFIPSRALLLWSNKYVVPLMLLVASGQQIHNAYYVYNPLLKW